MAIVANTVVPKKMRGRPATGRDPVTAIRLSSELRYSVGRWASKQADKPGRSEAIRRLIEIGLRASAPAIKSSAAQRARAAELAEGAIDELLGKAHPRTEDHKQRLIDGPSIVRGTRVDRPTKK